MVNQKMMKINNNINTTDRRTTCIYLYAIISLYYMFRQSRLFKLCWLPVLLLLIQVIGPNLHYGYKKESNKLLAYKMLIKCICEAVIHIHCC